jgi:hypothetical protein
MEFPFKNSVANSGIVAGKSCGNESLMYCVWRLAVEEIINLTICAIDFTAAA